ncbi:hypothetical protein BH20ACT23_BH20ACT23_15460 [soil metagenome]
MSVPERFVGENPDGIEAIVIRIGAGDAQLVLVDAAGRWDRWVYHSVDECTAVAKDLGITDLHEGEFPEKTRVRMNAYQKPKEEFTAAAYPEQGRVGPIIPYPENRRRPPPDAPDERSEEENSR